MIKPIGRYYPFCILSQLNSCLAALRMDPKLFIEIMGSYRRYFPVSIYLDDISASVTEAKPIVGISTF